VSTSAYRSPMSPVIRTPSGVVIDAPRVVVSESPYSAIRNLFTYP
jgi:hypothetical protein